jgi:hypothetical protein
MTEEPEMKAQIMYYALSPDGAIERCNYQKGQVKSRKLNCYLYPVTAKLYISYTKLLTDRSTLVDYLECIHS